MCGYSVAKLAAARTSHALRARSAGTALLRPAESREPESYRAPGSAARAGAAAGTNTAGSRADGPRRAPLTQCKPAVGQTTPPEHLTAPGGGCRRLLAPVHPTEIHLVLTQELSREGPAGLWRQPAPYPRGPCLAQAAAGCTQTPPTHHGPGGHRSPARALEHCLPLPTSEHTGCAESAD